MLRIRLGFVDYGVGTFLISCGFLKLFEFLYLEWRGFLGTRPILFQFEFKLKKVYSQKIDSVDIFFLIVSIIYNFRIPASKKENISQIKKKDGLQDKFFFF